MKPIHLISLLIILSLCNFSCKTNQITEKTPLFQCGDLKCSGKYTTETYSFCGSVPMERNYKLKVGKWRFWDTADNLIAEGTYKIEESRPGIGGCPDQQIKLEKVIAQDWAFFDSKGKSIHPPLGFIEYLEQTDFSDINNEELNPYFKKSEESVSVD